VVLGSALVGLSGGTTGTGGGTAMLCWTAVVVLMVVEPGA